MFGLGLTAAVLVTAFALWIVITQRSEDERARASELLILSQSRAEMAEERVALLSRLTDMLDEMTLILDVRLDPIVANASASGMLGMTERIPHYALVPTEILDLAGRAARSSGSITGVIELWTPERRTLAVTAAVMDTQDAILVVGRDISSERLVQSVRQRFVTNASHELKSPVASLMTLADGILAASREEPEEVPVLASVLVRDCRRLRDLVRDLLDLSRLEERAVPPSTIVDFSTLVIDEVTGLEARAHNASVVLSTNIESSVVVRGDAGQLVLLVRNLVDNAIRYMSGAGVISVCLRTTGIWVELEITDSGRGIPLKDQKRVFERFYRVDESRSRAEGGTGLGLSIVKHVVEVHGGEIELESVLGKGSRFAVRLPAGHQRAAAFVREETA